MNREILVTNINETLVLAYFDRLIEAKEVEQISLQYGETIWDKAFVYGNRKAEIFVSDLKLLLEAVGLETHRRKWGFEDRNWIDAYDYRGYTFADIVGPVKEDE